MRQIQPCRPANQNHVITLTRGVDIRSTRQQAEAGSLTKPAPQTVARDGSPQPPADGDTDSPIAIRVRKCKRDETAIGQYTTAPHHSVEVPAALEAEALLHDPAPAPLARSEASAAPSALVLNNAPATRRIHAPKEAVDTPPVTLLGLVRALDG